MNRRIFFEIGSKVAIGAAVASQLSPNVAFAAEGENVLIESEIGANHGHALNLDVADVIKLLRRSQSDENTDVRGEVISIQGQSGHPHDVSMTNNNLMALILGEELVLESSSVAGHSHTVLIKMSVG